MGLNRTTFGRHTSIQKVKYNARVSDLFAEIMKLFEELKLELDTACLKQTDLTTGQQANLLLHNRYPQSDLQLDTKNHQMIVNKFNLEVNLINFYNQVIELMTPISLVSSTAVSGGTNGTSGSTSTPSSPQSPLLMQKCAALSPSPKKMLNYASSTSQPSLNSVHAATPQGLNSNKLSTNILITFCLIFGYNLLNQSSNNNTVANSLGFASFINHNQLKHILKQIKDLDKQFNTFALRVKVIYFLLIMYTSFSANLMDENQSQNFLSSLVNAASGGGGGSGTAIQNGAGQQQVGAGQNSASSTAAALTDPNSSDLNVQRTFLDLLNSELDFQQNTVASARVSLLLKLDQFI